MDWIPFLAAGLRLTDLHDSSRTPGSVFGSPSEERPGAGDGLWLDVGTRLLEYLHERDVEANEAWVPLGAFFEAMKARHPQLGEADLQQVVSYLATPSELRFLGAAQGSDDPQLRISKDTALVERPAQSAPDRCRLSQRGRLAVALSRISRNWLYTHHDAEKIVSALLMGEFQDVPRQCLTLGQAIRSFAHEITRMLEQPGQDALVQSFRERGSHYLETISKVQDAVSRARELLHTAEVLERFDRWCEANPGSDLQLATVGRTLDELMQAVERLGRRFNLMIAELSRRRRQVVGNVRFDLAARALARQSPRADVLERCLAALAPWSVRVALVSPEDTVGSLRVDPDRHQARSGRVFDSESTGTLPMSPMDLFLESRRDRVLQALRAGPVSLGEACRRGWADVGGDLRLGELVGVYGAPDWLGEQRLRVVASLLPAALDVSLPDGTYLCGDDIRLTLLGEEEAAAP